MRYVYESQGSSFCDEPIFIGYELMFIAVARIGRRCKLVRPLVEAESRAGHALPTAANHADGRNGGQRAAPARRRTPIPPPTFAKTGRAPLLPNPHPRPRGP